MEPAMRNSSTDLLQGTLDLLILKTLSWGPAHGYAAARLIEQLTGHLVLSTLHTNDAPSSINRLMNMGIEPFLVATSVHLIVAQRLVRRICTFCKQPAEVPPPALVDLGFSEQEAKTIQLFEGRGCDRCSSTGYKGRIALYEVLEVNDSIRELILSGASAIELRQQSIEDGMITLRGSGRQKIRDGVTTIDEVMRETVN
jgi:type IV pilus assembly protein PilB